MDQSWFDLHQTFVGSMIVFLGVIVGLVGNGLLQRWDRRSKRDHDRAVMCSALLAELSFLLKSYEVRAGMLQEAKGSFDLVIVNETEVYDRLLDGIGVLSPEQGRRVIHAYLAAKQLLMNVRWNVEEADAPSDLSPTQLAEFTTAPHEGLLRVPPWAMSAATALHGERIELFKKAIAALRDS